MAPIKLSYIHLQEMVSVMLSLTSELDLKGRHYSMSMVCVEFSVIKECMFKWGIVNPFKSQYPHTNSPNRSPYISLKNYSREFGKRSNIFLFVIILLILIDFAHDSLWILLGEN